MRQEACSSAVLGDVIKGSLGLNALDIHMIKAPQRQTPD